MKRTLFLTILLSLCLQASAAVKVSILGDSYSTFSGFIPEGYAVFYPLPGNDVQSVEQTWWQILISGCGYELDTNNSYSGSTICNTGYGGADYSDRAFVSRLNEIGNPDILFIFGGTNDAWAGSPLGGYAFSHIVKENLYSFRPAMAYMLSTLKRLYRDTKIYFILNTELEEGINESVKKICGRYRVPVIVLHDIDKQMNHPSQAGMKAIAEQVRLFIENE